MAEHPPTTSDDDPWLTVQQVSEELKMNPATVRAWVRSGRLAAVRAGKGWRVRRSEVDRALLSTASPRYARQDATSSPAGSMLAEPSRTPAPRQMADHIITVGPEPTEHS
ncbi:MAG: helix-turn-helix domain-containing protein [Solirubrobacteraceae bacterium]